MAASEKTFEVCPVNLEDSEGSFNRLFFTNSRLSRRFRFNVRLTFATGGVRASGK